MNKGVRMVYRLIVLGLLTSISVLSLRATQGVVSSISALQTAINNASIGDTLVLANGHYTNNSLSIGKSNITVQAATLGGVYLDGINAITISGTYVTFSGFQFTSATTMTGSVISVSGNYNTLTQLNFNGYSADHMIYISGLNNLVSYCNFQNKLAVLVSKGGTGDMVQIIPNASNPGYNTIRYCSFQHMPGLGGDFGNECIRIGDGTYSLMISRTIVEYCYFEDTGLGDSEAISVKSRENVLRYNTMNNNPNAMFAFRNGDNNVAYSNYFIRSGGIRCKQANNIYCYNNYFELSGRGQNKNLPGSGTRPVYVELFGAGYGNNFNFIHNTFYRCTVSEMDTGMNCTWANNIFYSDSDKIFTGSTLGHSFAGNIYVGTLGLSISPGMINVDLKLTLNADGYYGLSSSSPAIDAASASYPAIIDIANINDDPSLLLDISGQTRPATATLKDIGCDEYNATGTVINRPLTLSNVGPVYLGGPATGVAEHPDQNAPGVIAQRFKLLEAYPNPFNPSTTITFSVGAYGYTSLRVYDLMGREVAVLMSEIKTPGSYSVQWDASGFGSGVYFCKMQAGSFTETKKIVLMK